MRTLIITTGLPASGKTTWAEQYQKDHPNTVIVCKDDIRAEFEKTGWTWSPENEKAVIKERDKRIAFGLVQSPDACVISADTNFGKHVERLENLAKNVGASVEMKDFTSVPVEVCVTRDAKRVKPVGEQVIRDMYEKYVESAQLTPYTRNPMKPIAIICDLDGTLALSNGLRGPFDHAKCADDRLNEPVAEIVHLFHKDTYTILYVSGREEKFRSQTEEFLKRNGLPVGPLMLRKTGDFRKDFVVKTEIFNTFIRKEFNVLFVLDDRDTVVKRWRELGLTCLQVAEGAF